MFLNCSKIIFYFFWIHIPFTVFFGFYFVVFVFFSLLIVNHRVFIIFFKLLFFVFFRFFLLSSVFSSFSKASFVFYLLFFLFSKRGVETTFYFFCKHSFAFSYCNRIVSCSTLFSIFNNFSTFYLFLLLSTLFFCVSVYFTHFFLSFWLGFEYS